MRELEPDVVESFKSNIGGFFASRNEYTQVNAILISWSQNDVGPEEEMQQLRSVLEKDFNYNVSSFAIPTDGTQAQRLNREISSFVENRSKTSDSLIVVYYSGHCYADSGGR